MMMTVPSTEQIQLANWLALGLTLEETATKLDISYQHARTLLDGLRDAMQMHTVHGIIRALQRNGLLPYSDENER